MRALFLLLFLASCAPTGISAGRPCSSRHIGGDCASGVCQDGVCAERHQDASLLQIFLIAMASGATTSFILGAATRRR